jgi:hypothetical protein
VKIISVGNSRVKHHNSATERKTNFAKIQYIDTRDEVKLNNKIALITGGTSGIGLAVFRATPTGCWELSGPDSARRLIFGHCVTCTQRRSTDSCKNDTMSAGASGFLKVEPLGRRCDCGHVRVLTELTKELHI